jgi:hypothetical protein
MPYAYVGAPMQRHRFHISFYISSYTNNIVRLEHFVSKDVWTKHIRACSLVTKNATLLLSLVKSFLTLNKYTIKIN